MKFILNLLAFFFSILLVACQSDSGQNHFSLSQKEVDTTQIEREDLSHDTTVKEQYETNTMADIEADMTDKYGTQWDFCDCIYKTDSINSAIENADQLSETDFEALMKRFEIIDQYCKSIIASPNTTPRERQAHESRVKRCKTEMGL